MGISTYSSFTYGHTITTDNQLINFSEGGPQLTATMPIGSVSLADFVPLIATALNNVGGQEYSTSLDRTTRKITISSVGNFELLPIAGTNSAISTYPLIGYTADTSGSNTYEADEASGFIYSPQNLLQKFTDFQDNVKTTSASVRQTPSGQVEVVSYGQIEFMECMVMPITDVIPQLSIISNANAVAEFRAFMRYGTTKAPMEFIENILVPTTFQKCLLESTAKSKQGVDFKIQESKKLFNWFESGPLVFRGLI